ncbi:hypothetical protein HLK59_10230 [Streptomyces sp. S3(2020)]|uniref:hypothetical protein n=1 Tax=Streptomyces sp. S3(2020) TaxID=2732044 RepID=UPI001488CC04|nr:hypothetical protein [Streptomyces sp. S3(2020)]NNN30734.1 hypothetical protein [Streptomyces sp. S3(2020)]
MAAGIGARCALLTIVEALAGCPSAAQSAVALTAAFLQGADEQVGPLLDEADLRGVAGLFAAATALVLERQPDGRVRLQALGLAAAESGQ